MPGGNNRGMNNDFPWTQAEFREMTSKVVAAYWETRKKQSAAKKKKGGKRDTGTRGSVTGGKHMDAMSDLVAKVVLSAGFKESDLHFDRDLILPGYYRAQKKWDIVVARNNRLHAVIELKSQSGSFGNNQNNRIEEVLGLARDFWVAYREKAFGLERPWVGYAFLLEDSPKSRRPVKLEESPFPALAIFQNTDYARRYAIACERLVLERDYDATALLLAKPETPGDFDEPAEAHSLYQFCRSLYRRLRAEA